MAHHYRMKIRPILVALALPLALTSCGFGQDPCRDVPRADQSLITAADDHPEIEIETPGYNDAECILTPSGNWIDEAQLDNDDSEN